MQVRKEWMVWGQGAPRIDTSRAMDGRWMKEEDNKVKRGMNKHVGMV